MKRSNKGPIIGALKKQIAALKDVIWDDNRMIAHYDNDIRKLQKRVKELEENWRLKEENEKLKKENTCQEHDYGGLKC